MQSSRSSRLAGAVSLVAGAVVFAVTLGAQSPQSPQPAATGGAHHMVSAKSIVWGPAPPSMPPGPKIAVLHGDPAKDGYFVMRLKAPDGFKVPPHYHPSDENLTVLSGTFMIGTGEKADPAGLKPLGAGDYMYMPKETRHYGTMKGETILQISGMGPFAITYVNPDDDPRTKKSPSQ
jgi:quercetin dioxygenase-like cupin family protein